MALNLNCIDIDLNLPATCIIDTDSGPVIRCWVPYMGWYYAKVTKEATHNETVEVSSNMPAMTVYEPSIPCDPSPLKTLIDVL